MALKEYEAAIASYDRAIAIQPDKHEAWYNRACAHSLLGQAEPAIENLRQAMVLCDRRYRHLAKTDSDFDAIRVQDGFRELFKP